ncbi:MAG: glycosyltransferase [Ruminococcus sp.]|nr:glycosyltransferase [Ruminococcus sp.]
MNTVKPTHEAFGTYSVLMAVYHKDDPAFLRDAIDSMLRQTVPPAQFVLVCDGPLTPELDEVIESYGDALDVLRLPENKGLGNALRCGLERCSCELVARMDSDDISVPDRCEKQLAAFAADDSLCVLSGAVEEFADDPEKPFAKRSVPLTHEEMLRYCKRRNPFNHVATMFRKDAILSVGSYNSDFILFEDYDLFTRVMRSGMSTANLPDTLVKVRAPADQFKRRGGIRFGRLMMNYRRHMRKTGWITRHEYMTSAYPHFVVCMMPAFMRKRVYHHLRK